MKILAFHAHNDDPISFLIKAITRSCYCHGAVLIEGKKLEEKVLSASGITGDGHLIVEAVFPKVHARLLTPDEFAWIDVFDVATLTPKMEAVAVDWLISQVVAAVSYDVKDLLRFLPQARTVLGEQNDEGYLKTTFCSMLVFNAYRIAGMKLMNCHDYEFSPDKMPWSPLVTPAPKLA